MKSSFGLSIHEAAVADVSFLDMVPIGSSARIVSISGDVALVQRLMEMGVLEGETVEVVAVAPLGDPLEIRVGDYRLGLRRAEAACVGVEVLT